MIGVNYNVTQPTGVVTTFVTILYIYWRPTISANVQLGYFLDESSFLGGLSPVIIEIFPLDISIINPALAIPPQILSQLLAEGGPLHGGTPV